MSYEKTSETVAGKAYRKMLMSQPRRIRDAWLYGKWSDFEGQFFDNYEYLNVAFPHDAEVPVAKTQQKLRELLLRNKGGRVAFISDPPKQGFQAVVPIDGKKYSIQIMATCRHKGSQSGREQEKRRIWRVLFHHMKGIFEAAASGVMEFREMMLPYIVTNDGRTVGEIILPRLDEAVAGRADRMLPAARVAKGDA